MIYLVVITVQRFLLFIKSNSDITHMYPVCNMDLIDSRVTLLFSTNILSYKTYSVF